MFASRQVWPWPTWTPACLPTRPPPPWSVSESTCWTWFPPVLFPKQPTHGNNAIPLPTDIIAIIPYNTNNNRSHDHANSLWGLLLCLKPCRGWISLFLFCWTLGVLSSLPQIFLLPSSLSESFAHVGVALNQFLEHKEYIEFRYLLFFFEGLHERVQFYKHLWSFCLSLSVHWLDFLEEKSPSPFDPGVGMGEKK